MNTIERIPSRVKPVCKGRSSRCAEKSTAPSLDDILREALAGTTDPAFRRWLRKLLQGEKIASDEYPGTGE
jgi:hypothetical protein